MVLALAGMPGAALADRGCAPLIAAALAGDAEAVSEALAEGADPDCFDAARNTALIYAARDGEGVTPLILAAFKGHEALVRLLLAEGARTELRDQWGRTALDYALRRGETDPIARMLRAAKR